jgi:CRISPR-associated protein Cas1
MIKRIIEISQAKTHLAIKNSQLIIRQDGDIKSTIPCEDIGLLLVDHPATTYTHSVFTELLNAGAAVVLCGQDHHPTGLLLPLQANTLQAERFNEQINAKEPLKKKLWKQIVKAKIKHQAKLIRDDTVTYKALMTLRDKVRSGDPDNIEAQASRKFWPAYLQDESFRRNPAGTPPNNLLNYGYMVMRAAIARALAGTGLLPCLGLHHHNRYNAFCLADDILEPFRGFVEQKVRAICLSGEVPEKLDQQTKAKLLDVLYEEVKIADYSGPLMVGLHRTAASLQRCFAGLQKEIELPEI